MWSDLPESTCQVRAVVQRFAKQEVAPLVRKYDEAEEFPRQLFQRLAELQLMGVFVPASDGGAGADNLTWVVMMEEIAKVDPSISLSMLGHCHAVRSLLFLGNEQQRRRYLVPAASGKEIAAFALTEPNAGSDAAAITTRAIREGDHYIIDGTKGWITNAAGVARTIVVAARTNEPKSAAHDGDTRRSPAISLFVLGADTPGFSFGRKESKLGCRSSMSGELLFERCKVPAENLLGEEGQAFAAIAKVFAVERLGNAAISLGAAEGALAHAIEYAKTRRTFGKPIGAHQGIRWMLADMASQIEASRLLVYRAAVLADRKENTTYQTAMAKLVANDSCQKVICDALQIFGANGYSRDYPVEKLLRDARMLSLGGGTTQIMREIVGKRLMSDGLC